MKEDCLFCKIAQKAMAASIVYEDGQTVAFNDIKPQAPVHVVIIPKKHIAKVSELKAEDSGIMASLVLAANKIASDKGLSETGYRLVINCGKDAGQEVPHIHMHLLGARKMGWPPG